MNFFRCRNTWASTCSKSSFKRLGQMVQVFFLAILLLNFSLSRILTSQISEFGGFWGLYFPVFGLNTKNYGVNSEIYKYGKYGSEKTRNWDNFHVVYKFINLRFKLKLKLFRWTYFYISIKFAKLKKRARTLNYLNIKCQ